MIKRAKDLGMRVHSSHFTWDSLLHPEKKGMRPFAEVLETAREHELTDLVVPYLHTVSYTHLTLPTICSV